MLIFFAAMKAFLKTVFRGVQGFDRRHVCHWHGGSLLDAVDW